MHPSNQLIPVRYPYVIACHSIEDQDLSYGTVETSRDTKRESSSICDDPIHSDQRNALRNLEPMCRHATRTNSMDPNE